MVNRFGRFLAVVLMALVAWPTVVQPARADDDLLITSDPYRHQELTDPPSGVVLAFTREVDAAAAQIVVTNSSGANVNINSLIVEGTNVTAQVKPNLPRDTYTVHYQVDRADGQVEGGAFQFAYGKGNWTNLPDERWSGNSAQPTVIASAAPEPATATATDIPSASPTSAQSETPVIPTGTATPTATPAAGGDAGATPWLWGGGAVLLAAAAGAVAWSRRKTPRSGGTGPTPTE